MNSHSETTIPDAASAGAQAANAINAAQAADAFDPASFEAEFDDAPHDANAPNTPDDPDDVSGFIDDAGVDDPPRYPWWHWRREWVGGLSLPILFGLGLTAVAGYWLLRPPSATPAGDSLTVIDQALQSPRKAVTNASHTRPQAPVSPPPGVTPAAPPASTSVDAGADGDADNTGLARAMKEQLTALHTDINRLTDSQLQQQQMIEKLGQALRTDETAIRQLAAAQARGAGATQPARAAGTPTEPTPVSPAPTPSRADTQHPDHKPATRSPVAGMHIVALDAGMAWIKWQDSTWSVRPGDRLGRVTITAIHPDTQTVDTTGGTVR